MDDQHMRARHPGVSKKRTPRAWHGRFVCIDLTSSAYLVLDLEKNKVVQVGAPLFIRKYTEFGQVMSTFPDPTVALEPAPAVEQQSPQPWQDYTTDMVVSLHSASVYYHSQDGETYATDGSIDHFVIPGAHYKKGARTLLSVRVMLALGFGSPYLLARTYTHLPTGRVYTILDSAIDYLWDEYLYNLQPGTTWVVDTIGHIEPIGFDGSRYRWTFVEFTVRYTPVYFSAERSAYSFVLVQFLAEVREMGFSVSGLVLRSDCAPELCDPAALQIYKRHNIQHRTTSPTLHSQNFMAEYVIGKISRIS
eukprot:gene30262-37801_t